MTNKQAYIITARQAGCSEAFAQAMANVSIYDPEMSTKIDAINAQYPADAAIAAAGYKQL